MNIKKIFFYIYFICFFSKNAICSKEKIFEQNKKNNEKITNKKINYKVKNKVKNFFKFIFKKPGLTAKYLFSILFAVCLLKDFYISYKNFKEFLLYSNFLFANRIDVSIVMTKEDSENILGKKFNNAKFISLKEIPSIEGILSLKDIFWFNYQSKNNLLY